MSEFEFKFSQKGQRDISEFMARGLLFEYLNDELDDERKKGVEDFIKNHPELNEEIRKIKLGKSVTDQLQLVTVSNELQEKLLLTTNYRESLVRNFNTENFPPALKMAIEGLFIALAVATLAIVIPWNSILDLNLGPKQVVLTEIVKNDEESSPSASVTSTKDAVEYPDDSSVQKAAAIAAESVSISKITQVMTPDKVSITTIPSSTTTTQIKVAEVKKGTEESKADKSTNQVANKISSSSEKIIPVKSEGPTGKPAIVAGAAETAAEKRGGALYRGSINVTNFRAITPKLVEKLNELGGRKAGQVELGWYKGETSYFHFTIPEGKFDEVTAFFNNYGKLAIQREPHDRVMPEGIRRVIITVYEQK